MFHRSERLLLRPGWIEDAAELTLRISDEGIVRNLQSAPWPYREENARDWLALDAQARFPSFVIGLPEATGNPVIGACGIHIGEAGPELGYWIARDWWGRGFATEAVRALLSMARALGHRRVHARHAVDNPASGKVLGKAGFQPTGRLVHCFSNGRGAEVLSREYVALLGECAGDNDPSEMPQAA